MSVFFLFLLALALGCLTTLYWIPGADLGRGYFQINGLIVLAALGLAAAVLASQPISPFAPGDGGAPALGVALVSAFCYYGAIWKERWRLAWIPLTAALAATGLSLLLAGPRLLAAHPPLPYRGALLAACLTSGAVLLGWSLITMLLGHWYLVVPRLNFRHLTLFCGVLLAAVLARLAVVGLSLATAAGVDSLIEPHPLRTLVALGAEGMFFWFRLLWGLVIPLLLAWMALQCARRRSNQSATGILYVLLVGTLIGEISALYLTVTTGVPV